MTDRQHASRPWRLRTSAFSLFAGLSVFLLENLIDPFVLRDATNNQLCGNTLVACIIGIILIVPLVYYAIRLVRQGYLEREPNRRLHFPVSPMKQLAIGIAAAIALFLLLVFATS